MPKVLPAERWRREVLERVEAFRHSKDIRRLREKGLAILKREDLVRPEEWWNRADGHMNSKEYREFEVECEELGAWFGLARWTVEWACLMQNYEPGGQMHILEAQWPQFLVVTEVDDDFFVRWLMYKTWEISQEIEQSTQKDVERLKYPFTLQVVHRNGSVSIPIVAVPLSECPSDALHPSHLPPRSTAFRLVIELPSGYPPEAAAEMARNAAQVERELARRLGYNVPQRVRNSPLTSKASKLRVGEESLDRGDIYDIVDDIYGEQDLANDQKLRNRVKSQRHRVDKRFESR